MEETRAVHTLLHNKKREARALFSLYGSAKKAVEALNIKPTDLQKREEEACEKEGIRLLSYADKEYPLPFHQLSDFPLLLYIKGSLAPRDSEGLSIVGTRGCTIYGSETAEGMAEAVAAQGITVISGLARGIDTAAHEGALKKGRTVAFIGSGLHHLYPKENVFLAEKIAVEGALITEYPLETPPEKRHFPERNRLVSCLAKGVLLVEAPLKSGAMITMHLAHKQGKHCFAIPGKIDKAFEGNHFLIKQQKALLVEKAEEMVSILLPDVKYVEIKKNIKINLTPEEQQLISLFPTEEVSIDFLAGHSGFPQGKLNALLMGLVLKKAIREFPGKYYKKVM